MDKVILGQGVVVEDGLGTTRPNDNQIIFGGTGSGKSTSVLWPTMCHMTESSFLGTFAKGELVAPAIRYFRELGYHVHVWNLAEPEKGDPLPDPLSYIVTDDDIQQTARLVTFSNPSYQHNSHHDPYWLDAAEGLLSGLMYYALQTEETSTMKKVLDLFYNFNIVGNNGLFRRTDTSGRNLQTSLDSQLEELMKKHPDSPAVRKLDSIRQLGERTAGCIRDMLEKSLQTMFPMSVQNAMSRQGYVDFRQFASERTAIFIITSPVKTIQYSFANLLFGIAIRQLMEFAEVCPEHRLPRPVRLIFDDFSCGFPVQDYEKSISTFRAAGISSLMLCQSLSQLDATYGRTNAMTILDNCSSMVYLPGGMNQDTCSYVSRMINLPMQDVLFMEMGNAIIFQTGQKPKVVPRYHTLEDPLYQKLLSLSRSSRQMERVSDAHSSFQRE